jgi:hypothetical protein
MLFSSRTGGWLVSFAFLIAAGLPARVHGQAAAPPDPALVARSDAAQKVVDDTLAKKAAADKVVKDAQSKVKLAIEGVVKSKADEAKFTGELAPLEKALVEKTASATKAGEDAKPVEKAYQDSIAVAKTATDNKAAADKLVVDSAAISKATADVAAAAKVAAEKAPTNKAVTDLKALADKVAADTAAVAKDAATKAEVAAKALTDTAAAAKAAGEKHAAAVKIATDAVAAMKVAEQAIAAVKVNVAKAQEVVKAADAVVAQAKGGVDQATNGLNAVAQEVHVALKSSEDALAAIGKLSLFSKHVAPVFTKRCLACHNAQTAKGRYNMDTYLGVIKGGEQGDTVIAKDPELSNLVSMIEDGSMPKDADPLTKEEIAAIKQWIANGARLDSGVKAEATLVSIIPKLPQPLPPEAYRVAVPITAVAFSPDGSLLASSGYHEVVVWNPNDGNRLRRITNIAERTYDIEFSADGKLMAVAAGTPAQLGEVKLFNPVDGTLIKDLMTTTDAVFAVAFSPDGKRLAACSADRSIRVFNLETGAQELLIEDHADWVMDIAWAPDGKKLASASRDKTSKVFDAKTGDSLVTFPGHNEIVYGVSFSPDGAQVLTAGRDNRMRAWNPADAKQIRELAGFGSEVYRVQISSDGRIFSCSADKTAREHKVADGAAVRTFSGHNDWVYSVTFNPATKKLATGSWDGEVRVWNAEDAKGLITFVAAPGLPQPVAAATAAK